MEVYSLLIGLTIGYVGCLIACYVDRRSILAAFMSEFVVYVDDEEDER